MTAADRKLKKKIAGWKTLCPEDLSEITDLRKANTATTRLERELKTIQQQFKQNKADDFEEFTPEQVSEQLKKVKAYQKELKVLSADLKLLRKWLTKVRSAAGAIPFAMVAQGNRKGSLHVFKQENRVRRAAQSGKQELSGGKIFTGTCEYTGGKLVFKFEGGARAPWKALLQRKVNQADVNMKVALHKGGDGDSESE